MAKMLRNKKGISPVVATVILVAVTIVVAVAVSYWMGGIAGMYTRFEKIEINSAYATYNNGTWTVNISLKNTGSTDATLDNILINGKPYTEFGTDVTITSPSDFETNGQPIPSGTSRTISLNIVKNDAPFSPGVNIEVRLHSAAGQEYPKTLTLP